MPSEEYTTPWIDWESGKIAVDCTGCERQSHRTGVKFYKVDLGQSDGGVDWYCLTCLAHLVRMPPYLR